MSQSYIIPDLVYSVCSLSDINVWKYTNKYLLDNIPSKEYLLIVPDEEVQVFKEITHVEFNVVPESIYVPGLKDKIKEKLPNSMSSRLGWYLQQFIKLSVLKEAKHFQNYLIWDADTIPLKRINFFRSNGEVEFYRGAEEHDPYFYFTNKLLGIGKVSKYSFIAQCFPCKGVWANNFFEYIENMYSDSYENTILNKINFEDHSGFSEYETLGNFIYNRFPDQVILSPKKWIRNGNALIGHPNNIKIEPYYQLINRYDHITFEKWEEPYSILKLQSEAFKKDFIDLLSKNIPSLKYFIDYIFNSGKISSVVKIGVNEGDDGNYLTDYTDAFSYLKFKILEPIDLYIEKFRHNYFNFKNVEIKCMTVGCHDDDKKIYFIHPDIVEDNSSANSKHFTNFIKSSFYELEIIDWLKKYIAKNYKTKINTLFIEKYVSSTQAKIVRTDTVLCENRKGLLFILDINRFGPEVLDGIDWISPPEWIAIENDNDKLFDYIEFFSSRGYHWVAGTKTKIFAQQAFSFSENITLSSSVADTIMRRLSMKIDCYLFLKELGIKFLPKVVRIFFKKYRH